MLMAVTSGTATAKVSPLCFVSSPAAFWGESEESSSELEAALRPQSHGADSDDFDDFYD